MTQLTISLPNELSHQLESLATKTGKTPSYYIQQAVEEFLHVPKQRAVPKISEQDLQLFSNIHTSTENLTEDYFYQKLGIK